MSRCRILRRCKLFGGLFIALYTRLAFLFSHLDTTSVCAQKSQYTSIALNNISRIDGCSNPHFPGRSGEIVRNLQNSSRHGKSSNPLTHPPTNTFSNILTINKHNRGEEAVTNNNNWNELKLVVVVVTFVSIAEREEGIITPDDSRNPIFIVVLFSHRRAWRPLTASRTDVHELEEGFLRGSKSFCFQGSSSWGVKGA